MEAPETFNPKTLETLVVQPKDLDCVAAPAVPSADKLHMSGVMAFSVAQEGRSLCLATDDDYLRQVIAAQNVAIKGMAKGVDKAEKNSTVETGSALDALGL